MTAAVRRAHESDARAEYLEVEALGGEPASALRPRDPPRPGGTRGVLRDDSREAQSLATSHGPASPRSLEMHEHAVVPSTADPEGAVAHDVGNTHASCVRIPADEGP